jgi:hypothetical protein
MVLVQPSCAVTDANEQPSSWGPSEPVTSAYWHPRHCLVGILNHSSSIVLATFGSLSFDDATFVLHNIYV